MPPSPALPLASLPSAQRPQPHRAAAAQAPAHADDASSAIGLDLSPFASPWSTDPQLERFLQQSAGLLSDWLATAAQHGPLPGLSVLAEVEPQHQGLPVQRLLADLQHIMEGAYRPQHPGAIAHLDPPPLSASIAAELICAGLNNNLLAEELSPSLSRLEVGLCAWLATRLGLPPGAGGVAASGGSLSNLMALVTARRRAGLDSRRDAVVICSVDAHVSLDKALVVMGLPPEALIRVPVAADGGLCPDALERQLRALDAANRPVMAVVATAGTTVRGAIDPLAEIGRLCRRYDHWLHVDGAIGAVFALAEQPLPVLAGLGAADSLTVNPQKVLGVTKTSSLLLLADPSHLQRTFATGLPYMEPSWGAGHGGEAGLQGSRAAEVLKLWLGLRHLGLQGVADVLSAAIGRRQRLEALLAAEPRLLLRSGPLHLIALRPRGGDAAASEAWSQRTRQRLLEAGLMLSRPLYRGHHHLKAVLGNPHTQDSHLQQLAELLRGSLTDDGGVHG